MSFEKNGGRLNLYLFGIPGKVGGASTKIRHLIYLLKDVFQITVILNSSAWLKNDEVTSFLKCQGVRYCLLKDLPQQLHGIALVICELDFFSTRQHEEVKRRGLKLVFSNEMMWE